MDRAAAPRYKGCAAVTDEGDIMRKLARAAVVTAVVATSLASGVGPAWADPPVAVEGVPPITIEACGTAVTITEVVNKEREHRKKTSPRR